MPAQKTDWKKVRKLMQDVPPMPGASATPIDTPGRLSSGKEILAKGTRVSEGNDGTYHGKRSVDDLLQILEANRKMYQALRKNKKRPPLKGLFGGGE